MTQKHKKSSPKKSAGQKTLKAKSPKKALNSPKKRISKALHADHVLRRIPTNVQQVLGDLQAQIQSGAMELSDWRSLGLGIMNRLGKVSESLKRTGAAPAASVKAAAKSARKRASALRPWAR